MNKYYLLIVLLGCMSFLDMLFPPKIISPIPDNRTAAPDPKEPYRQAIIKGFEHWGSPPAAKYADAYAEAPFQGEIFKKYPFLLPAQSIAETSGGAKQKFQNNPQNWGIVPQGQGNYTPTSPEQVINDAMTAIGGSRSIINNALTKGGAQPRYTPTQINTEGYYTPFRESQDLMDFAKVYAPPGENDTEKYVRDLLSIMSVFESMMPQKELTNAQ
jgi:hypothetical protein